MYSSTFSMKDDDILVGGQGGFARHLSPTSKCGQSHFCDDNEFGHNVGAKH